MDETKCQEARIYMEYKMMRLQMSEQWYNFTQGMKKKNRFFPGKSVVDYINRLPNYAETLPKGTELYRARIVTVDLYDLLGKASGGTHNCWGLPKSEMGAPPDSKASPGRANPSGIRYLYLASTKEIACAEVRPVICDSISVSKFVTTAEAKIVNLHQRQAPDQREREFILNLMWEFYMPCREQNDREYAATQYISAFCQDKGLDGIKYCSVHSGNDPSSYNLVLFDTGLAECADEFGEMYRCINMEMAFQNISVCGEVVSRTRAGHEPLDCMQISKISTGFSRFNRSQEGSLESSGG